ncbi:GntR family transcriptional regulator [Paludifilum halophilum]|uniref:GntR family transcriptional regulator n=1 Tax=Paludifilum halophilum TaxID=1642702 RepID=A0A235B7N6_9BACL|nr:GntR family transcriptional regulator [Paludifilum halophilum]OYD08306.1 GntR family transcriptional regulator [Paludifilum halophilum]
MGEKFIGTAPIYYQIVERICSEIVRGGRKPGDKLPSVRELAVRYEVNPNTAKRVYMEMERMGIAEVRRGLGTFVTEDEKRLAELRERLQREKVETFIREMERMGFSPEEISEGLNRALQRRKTEGGTTNE